MTESSDFLRRFRFISDQLRSGDITRIENAVQDLIDKNETEVIARILEGTYVDMTGVLWVPPDFAVMRSKQANIDYGFWQLLALAPKEACRMAGIDRNRITVVKFRSYSETLVHPDDLPVYYGELFLRMEKFPEAICRLPALTKIDARDTTFRQLPETLGDCSLLTSFSLAFFKGNGLPDSIGKLSALEELQLIHCKFEKWPDGIAGLPMLKVLRISACKISSIPAEIKLPVSAEVIHLDNIGLQDFPESVFDCTKLRELSLLGNSIREIPYKFDRLPVFERINLRDNPVAYKEEQINPIRHFVMGGTATRLFREIPGDSAFRSSFIADRFASLPASSPFKEENPFPYKHPGNPPDDIADAVRMISGMLTPSEEIFLGDRAVFNAGINLLSSCGADAAFTEFCLSVIPIEKSGYLTIHEMNEQHLKLLFDFLIENPERSLCSEGSWRYALRFATIPFNSGCFNRVVSIFPNLKILKLNLREAPAELNDIQLGGLPRTVHLTRFFGKSMEFDGSGFSAGELVFEDSYINGCITIKGLKGLKYIFIHNSAISELKIFDCPDLDFIEYDRKDNNDFRVTKIEISDCPSLNEIRLKQIRLSGLTLNNLPALKKMKINGQCTNTRKYKMSGCTALKELDMISCRLSEFPDFIADLSQLEILRLKKCNLSEIGGGIGRLKNLITLDLSGNILKSVPEAVQELSNLEILHLGYQGKNLPTKSYIQSLPDNLNALKKLKYIAVMMPELKLRRMATNFRSIRLPLTNRISR